MLRSTLLSATATGAILAAACGGSSRADAVVGDETLFNEEFPEAIEFMRDECPAFAEAAGVQVDQMGAATASAGLMAAVPEGYRPEITAVTARHGAPDSMAGDFHYYDDIALRVDASGLVVAVEMACGTARGGE